MKRPIYGISSVKKPLICEYAIPPEKDVNAYMIRVIRAIASIKDKDSKDTALLRMELIASDIQKALEPTVST